MYDYDILGKYANAFHCVLEAIDTMVTEFTNMSLGSFEIKTDDNGEPIFDHKKFETIMVNIAAVDAKADLLRNLFYNGYKTLAAKDKEGNDEGTNEERKETV